MADKKQLTILNSLSMFVPCFNEAKNLPFVLDQAIEVLPKVAKKFEIIVVDDGSTDETSQVVKEYQKNNTSIRLATHGQNKGYGAAVRTGIESSNYDWIFYTDGDGQFDINELIKIVAVCKEGTAVLGYRKKRVEGLKRVMMAKLYKLYIDLLFRVHVKDIDCAFKLFKAEDVKNLDLFSNGAFISAEILYKLKKKKISFKQLPVKHYPRKHGVSSGASLKVIVVGLWEPLKLYLKMKLGWQLEL